jgi:hypothetical protein
MPSNRPSIAAQLLAFRATARVRTPTRLDRPEKEAPEADGRPLRAFVPGPGDAAEPPARRLGAAFLPGDAKARRRRRQRDR